MELKFSSVNPHLCTPRYATEGASGFDLVAATDVNLGDTPTLVPTGVSFEIPEGYEIQIRPRSGLSREGVEICNAPGTIDSDYRGEVKVLMRYVAGTNYQIRAGQRVAQGVLAPVVKASFHWVERLTPSVRGSGGFGSTGK